jgi:hypothetical protein
VVLPHNQHIMKNYPLKKIFTFVLLLVFVTGVYGQATSKPSVFQNQPNEITMNNAVLDALFAQGVNTPVHIALTNNFILTGTLTNIIEPASNQKSLIIKISNFNNLVFSISKISDIHTPQKYVGRLLNAQQYADYYELVQENGIYKLKKQQTEQILVPCKQ